MAENPKASTRLRPILHDYLADLVKLGAYGKGKSGVIRRLIENGIVAAVEAGAIQKRDIRDYGESIEDEENEN